MKKLIIGFGVLSVFSNIDAMRDDFRSFPVKRDVCVDMTRSNRFTGYAVTVGGSGVIGEITEDFCQRNLSGQRIVNLEVLDGITRIGRNTFLYQMYLKSVKISASVRELGINCFLSCTSLSRVEFASDSQLEIIGRKAFFECVNLESVKIPASVKEIGVGCFATCSNLSHVEFASGSQLEIIGRSAFFGTNISEVRFPGSVHTLESYCFSKCGNLKDLIFESDSQLKTIGENAFSWTAISDVIIPRSVETLGEACFSRCLNLREVTFELNSRLKSIGERAFSDTFITEVIIPRSVQTVGDSCFSMCTNLEKLQFEECSRLKSIGESAFESCRLEEFWLPNSVEEIGDLCFGQFVGTPFKVHIGRDSQLRKLGARVFPTWAEITDHSGRVLRNPDFGFDPNPETVMGRNLYWRGSRFLRGDVAEGAILTIPNTIKEIAPYCCYDMHLVEIIFEVESQVRKIGHSAFKLSLVESNIRIPDSVEEIGDGCFCWVPLDEEGEIIFGAGSRLNKVGEMAFWGFKGNFIVFSERTGNLLLKYLRDTYGSESVDAGNTPQVYLPNEEESE